MNKNTELVVNTLIEMAALSSYLIELHTSLGGKIEKSGEWWYGFSWVAGDFV